MVATDVVLATVHFHNPTSIVGWIIVGFIAGWAASHWMGNGGFGVIGDIIVGLLGAAIGGALVGLFWAGSTGFIGSIMIAFIGACVLIWLLRLVSGHRAV
jgi:uncharacterized membrane protein YeaQ/YmgE (transglycosylase-associated protein family)